MEPVDIRKLADRVENFLAVNEKARLSDLKLHLGCRGTELLLASGWLMKEEKAAIEKDGVYLWIISNK